LYYVRTINQTTFCIGLSEETYPRREHYKHYVSASGNCTFSLTANIDVTHLQANLDAKGFKTFPSHCWLFSKAANGLREFRMAHNAKGELGIWDYVSPRYNVFHESMKTFGGIWTAYDADFRTFYENCIADMRQYANKPGFALMEGIPNIFDFSCLPWVHFTGFNLNIYTQAPFTWLVPQITIGKYASDPGGRLQLPVAIQVHHAVCDGYHLGKFLAQVQELADGCKEWL
jgi:chloramphenicol O-acetyltransferase type A